MASRLFIRSTKLPPRSLMSFDDKACKALNVDPKQNYSEFVENCLELTWSCLAQFIEKPS